MVFTSTAFPRFGEACEKLGVVRVSEIDAGYWGKAFGAVVETADGNRYWLKVFGVTFRDNANRLAEIRADEIVGIRKPSLVAQCDWGDAGIHYTARLTTLANAAVECNPWASAAAAELPESWFNDLMTTLNDLSAHASTGTHLKRKTLEDWLLCRYQIRYEFPQDDWRLSHNDLNWSNVTAPVLSVLDWEWHGYSPVGYDPGRLIAFSCRHERLVSRLERAFASCFASFTGLAARTYATHVVDGGVKDGSFDPELGPALDRMLNRLDDELRIRSQRL